MVNLVAAPSSHGNVQVCDRQDTPPVEDPIWAIPRPSSGWKNPLIPPHLEPLLNILPTDPTGPESPSVMVIAHSTTLSSNPGPKLANSLVFKPVLKSSRVNHPEVSFIQNQVWVLMHLLTIGPCSTRQCPQGCNTDGQMH
jgi:hypothetical protein